MEIDSAVLYSKLKTFFGYDSFKGDQEAIIRNLIEGKDTFVFYKERFDAEPDIPDEDDKEKDERPKKLYLVALLHHRRYVQYVQELPDSSGPQAKYYAEKYIKELEEDFRLLSEFYVVASADKVEVGDLIDTEKIEICFALL